MGAHVVCLGQPRRPRFPPHGIPCGTGGPESPPSPRPRS